ncbi:MAG: photosynthetic complex putative assembly protein PuhB [Pseudomonadota bacterium]
MNDDDMEPIRGLPQELPSGEHIVWQGEPVWRELARRVFHVRKVTFYFVLLIGWYLLTNSADQSLASAFSSTGVIWTATAAVLAVAILCLLAWLYAKTTVYTLTNRRLVLRFGVALPIVINLPLNKLESADLHALGQGHGDIALTLIPGERISYWALWPHARPWHFSSVKPMLRGLQEAERVAVLLADQVLACADDPQSVTVTSRLQGERQSGEFVGTQPAQRAQTPQAMTT